MANTADITMQLIYRDADNATRFQIPPIRVSKSLTSNLYIVAVQNIGTTHEALDVGSLSTVAGPMYLYNRNATNYVEIGLVISTVFTAFFRVGPEEVAFVPRVSDLAIYAKANTAACDLEYWIAEP